MQEELSWVRKEMEIVKSIRLYDSILIEKCDSKKNMSMSKDWIIIKEEVKDMIRREYKELYQKEKSFEEIYSEYQRIIERLEQNKAQVEYKEDKPKR